MYLFKIMIYLLHINLYKMSFRKEKDILI